MVSVVGASVGYRHGIKKKCILQDSASLLLVLALLTTFTKDALGWVSCVG